MKELQKKKKKPGNIYYSIPSIVLLLIAAFFMVKGAIRVMEKELESREISKNLKEETTTLARREEELRVSLARLRTEEGVRDEIRERFNVTEAGEHVAVIVDERGTSSTTDDSALPWYKRIWSVIMGNK